MSDAIERCREAIHDADDMLAMATREDFAALLDLFDAQARCIKANSMAWEESELLRARVESQRQVIEDLRREIELACRRIVELERGAEDDGA